MLSTMLDHQSAYTRRFGADTAKWCLYLFAGFAIVNYTCNLPLWHFLGPIWDKIVLILLSFIALTRYIQGYRPLGFAWSKFAGWYVLYCIALMLEGIHNPVLVFDGFTMDVEFILFGMLIPYVMEETDLPKILHVVIATSVLLGIHGVLQYLLKVPIPGNWLDVGETVRTRVFSLMQSPAELGANMELTLPVMTALLLVDTHKIRRWIYAIGGLCCLGTLVFTFDRGSWLGLGCAILIIAVVYERRLVPILIILAVILFFVPSVHHRVMDLFNEVYIVKSAQGGRIMLWQQAFDVMARNPLFGAGLGRYGGAIATVHTFSLYSDNYYAKILGESGLIGLTLFIAMHVSIVREIVQTVVKRSVGRHRALALAGLTGVVAILVHSFVENLFEYSYTASLYYLMVGTLLLWGRTLQNEDAVRRGTSSWLS